MPGTESVITYNTQIERRRLPTLDLGVINKQTLVLPLPPPSSTTPIQHCHITTITNSHHRLQSPLTASNDNGTRQYHKKTTRAPRHHPRSMQQLHVTQGRSSGQVPCRQRRRGNLTNNEQRRSLSLTIG
jgi:hypothetical protein